VIVLFEGKILPAVVLPSVSFGKLKRISVGAIMVRQGDMALLPFPWSDPSDYSKHGNPYEIVISEAVCMLTYEW
jgi:hypothetical protein